jgi:hypothetical protein
MMDNIPVTKLKNVIRALEILKANASERADGFAKVNPFQESKHRGDLAVEFQRGKVDAYRRTILELEALLKVEGE